MNPTTLSMVVGSTKTISLSIDPYDTSLPVSWTTNDTNKSVVILSNNKTNGITVYGKGVGSATITAECGGKTKTCPVTVTEP